MCVVGMRRYQALKGPYTYNHQLLYIEEASVRLASLLDLGTLLHTYSFRGSEVVATVGTHSA